MNPHPVTPVECINAQQLRPDDVLRHSPLGGRIYRIIGEPNIWVDLTGVTWYRYKAELQESGHTGWMTYSAETHVYRDRSPQENRNEQ